MANFLEGVLGAKPVDTFEPQRTNSALLVLDTGKLGINWEELRLSLASFPLPKNETDIITVPYMNEVRKFAGRTVFNDLNITFHDYVSRDVAKGLWAWRYKVYNPNTGVKGLKINYAVSGSLTAYAPDGSRGLAYNLINVWPATLDMGDIDMGADEPVRIACTFACDKVYWPDPGVIGTSLIVDPGTAGATG